MVGPFGPTRLHAVLSDPECLRVALQVRKIADSRQLVPTVFERFGSGLLEFTPGPPLAHPLRRLVEVLLIHW